MWYWKICLGISLIVGVSAFTQTRTGLPADLDLDDKILSEIANDVAHKFKREYMIYQRYGIETPLLKQLSKELAQSHSETDIFINEVPDLDKRDQFFVCTTCRATISILADMFRDEEGVLNGPDATEILRGITLDVCERLELKTAEVCGGLFDLNWPTIQYIIKNTDIDSKTFCSMFMEVTFCNELSSHYNWSLTVDASTGPLTAPKSGIPEKSVDDLQILQLTDIHFDPLYEPGSLAECEEPMCCQRHKGISEGTTSAAGYWGDYRNCDNPLHTIENAFAHIRKTHEQIDYIYQTGDIVDHMKWATSIEKNTDVLTLISEKLDEYFPGVPVYPCVGNHEPNPSNVFSPSDVPDNINTRWLYEHLYSLWSKWLPADTEETILKGGYYTVSPKAGFRVIVLNSIDCYTSNWWLYYDGSITVPQLEWLHDTLLAAEKADEYVHILSHIPSGDGTCWSVWSREYNRIVERFSKIISGIFNGHSHNDEMHVHYSEAGHAMAMSWNGGSLTPYKSNNPNYRLYQVDPKSWSVLDHETWIFNLTAANELGATVDPVWFKEYDFSSEFTKDLSPAGVNAVLDEMADNPDLLRKFWRFKMTSADPRLASGCNDACLMSTICRLATTVNNQKTRCLELQAKLTVSLEKENETTEATTSSTSTTTTSAPTTEDDGNGDGDGDDDGASTMVTLSLSTMLTIYALLKLMY